MHSLLNNTIIIHYELFYIVCNIKYTKHKIFITITISNSKLLLTAYCVIENELNKEPILLETNYT